MSSTTIPVYLHYSLSTYDPIDFPTVIGTTNLINNGDFEAGNIDFLSNYKEITTTGKYTNPGEYSIITNPKTDFTNGYVSFGDHTSGNGLMLFADGSSSNKMIWSQSVSLPQDTEVTFSAWIANAYNMNNAKIALTVDGHQIGSSFSAASAGKWEEFTTSFNTGSGGETTIAIVDTNSNYLGRGNDVAIDDISLNVPQEEIIPQNEVTVLSPEFYTIAEDNVIEPNEQEDGVVISGSAEDGTVVTLSSGDFNVELDQTIDNSWTYEFTSDDYELLDTDEFGYASINAVAVNENGDESDETFIKVLIIDSQNWKIGDDNKNTLSGKNIYGGDGADTLKGNSTDGLFIGGAGKDTITGGKGFDTFMYLDITDSGTTKATRDVIKDFKSLEDDKIDLSHLPDSSNFHFTDSNVFDGEVGSIIFNKGILSLDLDGDKKTDFSIELTGTKMLDPENLILSE